MCVSLPTLKDVVGYEERKPRVMRALRSGYPRFISHHYVERLAERLRESEFGLGGRQIFLTQSVRGARLLADFVGAEADPRVAEAQGCHFVHTVATETVWRRGMAFLQHTGYGISSRFAEDRLIALGEAIDAQREPSVESGGSFEVRYEMARYLGLGRADSVLVCNSGMNAFFAAFQAARDVQRPLGRRIWVQLGWLYLDTGEILRKFTLPDERVEIVTDLRDLDRLERLFAAHGGEIAGVITETPTNPLLQTVDLPRVYQLCQANGALLIADPTLGSFWNVSPIPFADIVVTSLTKYTAGEGDVMAGALVINPDSPMLLDLLSRAVAYHDPLYKRDLARLTYELADAPELVGRVNASTPEVVRWLEGHSKVRRVHWAYSDDSAQHYTTLAGSDQAAGAVFSVEFDLPLAKVYDRLPMAKGPSFGTHFTMACPFMYLAHYRLASTKEGRRELLSHGLNPDLIRFSLGTESPDEIIAALTKAIGRQ